MTETADFPTERWAPDELLVPAILAGSRTRMADLSAPDRAWVVAHMKLAGYTAEQTADRLDCSVRSVRSVWSDAGVIVALYLTEADNFGNTYRMLDGELRQMAVALGEAERDRDRYKAQLDRMLDTLMTDGRVLSFPCGCPRTRYNTYVAPKTGKAGCREHRRLAVARHRARRRQLVTSQS
ncbi:hypothetical protein SEA_ZENTENO07_85 [Mycobacterium phage Zenteno07]|nr:hypothetical protein SEA_ZENTENO07_85 [Mycobacterium phage Zenteno07]